MDDNFWYGNGHRFNRASDRFGWNDNENYGLSLESDDMTKLNRPTVQDVINALKDFPADSQFRIEDADTNWEISIFNVMQDKDGWVWFDAADYGDMGDTKKDYAMNKSDNEK